MTIRELTRRRWDARGVYVPLIARSGDESLAPPELLDTAADFPETQFLLITAGSLVDEAFLDRLERLSNVTPVLSLEDLGGETHEQAVQAMERMQERRMFFGTLLTITYRNFPLVTSRMFVRDLVERGCGLFFYTDYVAITPATEHLVPSPSQRKNEALSMALLRREFHALFLTFSTFTCADLRGVPLSDALRSHLPREIGARAA
ncbi:MAG: hypothetical protein A2133_00030 [Actinobacteria bacterium RBG_16_64_13]|nr:MAG: hypothetical protein A2133_00030 [Actinobacteria bacterium RBG_16_64_13]